MSGVAVGQFDFDDGGNYSGGSDGGKAHGLGVCTGPGGQGEYSGVWQFGFELSGVYTWPNGNNYAGQWMQGKRHGLGVEKKGHWVYRGEWTQGAMGRYGVRQSTTSDSKYEGTWTSGLQDGYGLETYSDGGTYQGQWMKGSRHGYGVRRSAVYSKAAKCRQENTRRSSVTSVRSVAAETTEPAQLAIDQHNGVTPDSGLQALTSPRIGFFLKGRTDGRTAERRGSVASKKSNGKPSGGSMRRQRSAGDLISEMRDGPVGTNLGIKAGFTNLMGEMVETYTGEWKLDRRSGFGVSERSDGVKYEGEWFNNCKNGYGVTTYADGTREEGKYKNNLLQSPSKRTLILRAAKYRERIDTAVNSAVRSAQIAIQKSDIANSRMESARSKAELADQYLAKAKKDSEAAKRNAKEISNSEHQQIQQGLPKLTKRLSIPRQHMVDTSTHDNNVASVANQPSNQTASNLAQNTDSLQNRRNLHPDAQNYNQQQLLQPQVPQQRQYQSQQLLQPQDARRRDSRNLRSSLTPVIEGESRQGSSERLPNMASIVRQSVNFAHMNHTNVPSMNHAPQKQQEMEEFEEEVTRLGNHVGGPGENPPEYQDRIGDASLDPDTDRGSQQDSGALSEEIENIFSYLADEETEIGGTESTVGSPSPPPISSKPSLRQRRDVRVPNLVIFRRDVKPEEKLTNGKVKRRLTLPSIIKYKAPPGPVGPVAGRGSGTFVGSVASLNVHTQANGDVRKPMDLHLDPVETIVIEDGIRKRLEEEMDWRPPPLPPDIDPVEELIEPPKELQRRFKLENVKMTRRQELGSMPDISMFPKLQAKSIPWHEAELLSQQRREEIKLIEEEAYMNRRRAIVLKLGDFKDWLKRKFFVLVFLAFNVALVSVFYQLLFQ